MKQNFKYLELLTESQLIEEQSKWNSKQWHNYFTQEGEMSLEEFKQFVKKEVFKEIEQKYGNHDKQASN